MRSAVRLTATERERVTERTQIAALNRALRVQGVTDPGPDEGLRIAYDDESGVLAVEADRDVTALLEAWVLAPPPSERTRIREQIAAATTLTQLKAALAEAVDGGVLNVVSERGT